MVSINPETGAETYTPYNHLYNWINFTYGKDWKVGFYGGYLKNMGTSENAAGPFYGMTNANEIDMIYKISPQLMYNFKNFMFAWEVSWTTAAYGEVDKANKSKVINTENITAFRNMLSIAYKF